MSYKRSWTDEQLTLAVSESFAIAQVLRKLDLAVGGYNGKYVKKHIIRLGLNTSHFRGKLVQKSRNSTSYSSNITKEQLIAGTAGYHNKTQLKQRLIKEGLIEEQCVVCGQGPVWLNKPLSLHMDHIDGNSANDLLSNLRILCPNCHTQTETYCGRNHRGNFTRVCKTPTCDTKIYSHRTYCNSCFKKGDI